MPTLTKSKLGPRDHGRKMSLKKFEFAEVEEGYHVELARGYIVVSEVPQYDHAMQVLKLAKRYGSTGPLIQDQSMPFSVVPIASCSCRN